MSQFEFLSSRENLYIAMTEVEQRINADEWDVAVQNMGRAVQVLVQYFYELYGVFARGSLNDQINTLKRAQVLSPDSANAYHVIGMKSKEVADEYLAVSKDEALLLYGGLIGEVILFTEKYSKDLDPNGKKNIETVMPEKVRVYSGQSIFEGLGLKGYGEHNRFIPSELVRLIGVINMIIGLAVMGGPLAAFGVIHLFVGLYCVLTGFEVVALVLLGCDILVVAF